MKIKNSLEDKNESIGTFVEKEIIKLEQQNKIYFVVSTLINLLIALLTIGSIIVASDIIWYINTHAADRNNQTMPYVVAICTILLFVISIIIIIYQNKMKAKVFLEAAQNIQFLVMEYYFKKGQFTAQEKDKLFRTEVKRIYDQAIKVKHSANFRQSLLKVLVGEYD